VSVAIIDYGSGNLHSAAKAFERAAREEGLNEPIMVTSDPEEVRRADRVVLPGVGAFADCRRGLDAVGGMVEALNDSVRARARPFLGICVGMQLMAERGREYEVIPGLGWIPGEVDRIAPSDPTRSGRIRCSTVSTSGRTDCMPISYTLIISRRPSVPISSPRRTTAVPSPQSLAVTP